MKSPQPGRPDPETLHLELDVLLELSLGLAEPETTQKARVHLLGCEACRERLQSLYELPQEPAEPSSGHDLELEKGDAWRRLSETLPLPPRSAATIAGGGGGLPTGEERPAATSLPANSPQEFFVPEIRAKAAPPWAMPGAVAAIVVASVLAFWIWDTGRSRSGMVSAATTHLLPIDFSLLGSEPPTPQAACPEANGQLVLILGGLDGLGASRFEVELKGPETRLQITTPVNPFGECEISFPRSLLVNGEYSISVRRTGEPLALKEYRLTLACP